MATASSSATVALYFVASPLQYLAARRIAQTHEQGARQVLVWYKPGVAPIVRAQEWDASGYMPWPRWEPLPGHFGRLRRQQANLHLVADWVGSCQQLHIHSAVFDTEAINYFLRALPKLCGAAIMHARILPDGIISTRRYPLSWPKRLGQRLRRLRKLVVPELDYWCFAGDRIGSDAPFCDRIYVLPGLPHEYPAERTVTLAPLVTPVHSVPKAHSGTRRALVIGQPLAGAGLMSGADSETIGKVIHRWLQQQGFDEICYKGHPKDAQQELNQPDYRPLTLNETLEEHLARKQQCGGSHAYHGVVSCVRQVGSASTQVVAFGWDKVRFKSDAERQSMAQTFGLCGIELLPGVTA